MQPVKGYSSKGLLSPSMRKSSYPMMKVGGNNASGVSSPDSYNASGVSSPDSFDPYALGAGVLGGLLFAGTAKKKRRGQTLGAVASGATTGASLGSIFGPIGTGVGGGVGALAGGIIGSSEKSPEEIRDERFNKLVENTTARRNKALADGTTAIGKQTSGLAKRFTNSAARRASAMGRVSDVEAFQAPIAGRVANEGNKSLSDFILNTNAQYDDILAQIDQARLMGEDIDPNMTDYLSELAPVAAQYAGNERQLSVLKKYLNLN